MFSKNFNSFLIGFSDSAKQLTLGSCECKDTSPCVFCETKLIRENVHHIENCLRDLNFHNLPELLKRSSIKQSYIFISTVIKRDHKGETILHKRCRDGNIDQVSELLAKGHDPNTQDYAGWTPLHEAVVAQKIKVAKLLLDYGALINSPGLNYITVLHQAVLSNNIPLTKLLIEYGADVTALTLEGKTPTDLCNNNNEMLTALCLTIRNQNILQVYIIPRPKIYFFRGSKEDILKANRHQDFTVLRDDNLLAGEVNYAIVGSTKPSTKHLQFAMLQGALVVEARWLDDFIDKTEPLCPTNYLTAIAGFALHKAAENKFRRNPKLFDKLQIYFCFKETQIIDQVMYTIADLKLLVRLGGGEVIKRRPSRMSKLWYPYHAKKTNSSPTICYFIYDQYITNFYENNYEGIKYKPINWLIECVNKFCIV